MVNKKSWLANLLLLLVAAIWGSNYVAQSIGARYLPAPIYNYLHFCLGAICVLPITLYRHKTWCRSRQSRDKSSHKCCDDTASYSAVADDEDKFLQLCVSAQADRMAWRLAIPGGILAGVLVSLGSLFLQMGMATANVGTAGVISGLYVVLVPFIGLFFRERIYVGNLISSLLALAGLFLICYTPGGTFAIGDIYLLISVLFYSLHIRAISRWAVACDSLKLAVLQMTVAAFMSLLFALFQRMSFDLDMIYAALPALLYTGIMNSGVAFSLQAIAQNHAPAAHAAIIMSMESLFAVISGWIFLNEQLTLKVYLGIVLMIGAMLLSQFVGLRHSRKNSVSDDSEVDSGEFCG